MPAFVGKQHKAIQPILCGTYITTPYLRFHYSDYSETQSLAGFLERPDDATSDVMSQLSKFLILLLPGFSYARESRHYGQSARIRP